MYILIHGYCKAAIQDKEFLEARRLIREDMLKLYKVVGENIDAEAILSKTDIKAPKFIHTLQEIIDLNKKLI